MWTDAAADPPRCPGSGEQAHPAPPLPDGYPDGRALCPACLRFIARDDDGRLEPHETSDASETVAEAERRRDWFNAFGW